MALCHGIHLLLLAAGSWKSLALIAFEGCAGEESVQRPKKYITDRRFWAGLAGPGALFEKCFASCSVEAISRHIAHATTPGAVGVE
jgi:hypothetical protein